MHQNKKAFMKRTIPALILAGLILAAMTSCQKDDDTKPATGSTTSSTSTTTGSTNPLTKKACNGTGTIMVDNVSDTMYAMEALFPPLNLYGIYTSGTTHDISMQSGAKGLPSVNTTFTVAGDPNKIPGAKEMILDYYDDDSETDYYAVSGKVEYTISSSAKKVKFTNIQFKSDAGDSKVISFEVNLK
jgi:hypothetical protein